MLVGFVWPRFQGVLTHEGAMAQAATMGSALGMMMSAVPLLWWCLEARKTEAVAHVGRIFDTCGVKLSRLTSVLAAGSVRVAAVLAYGANNWRVDTLQICAQGHSFVLAYGANNWRVNTLQICARGHSFVMVGYTCFWDVPSTKFCSFYFREPH